MTQSIHPMLNKLEAATSDWSVGHDTHYDGWRVRHGCVLFGELHKTEACAKKVMRRDRARAAVQALMEPDEGMRIAGKDALWENEIASSENAAVGIFQAMLRLLVEGEGE